MKVRPSGRLICNVWLRSGSISTEVSASNKNSPAARQGQTQVSGHIHGQGTIEVKIIMAKIVIYTRVNCHNGQTQAMPGRPLYTDLEESV